MYAVNRVLPTPQHNLGGNVWNAEAAKRSRVENKFGSQTGPVLAGPGALKAQAQATLEAIQNAVLPVLTSEQEEMVEKARKFAMEQSIKTVILKQTLAHTQQQQKSLQRHQALVLMCRIYVGSISFELKEETVRNAFKPFGPVKAINMSYDTVTGRHKGFAFVEFELPEAAQLALDQMNGVLLGGRNIKVGRPSNMPQAAPVLEQIMEESKSSTRIYIACIHQDLSEVDIQSVFEAFGKIKSCKLAVGTLPGEKHREFGFIDYETSQAASDAIASMNMFDLGGQYLRVGRAITPPDCTINPNGLIIPPAPSLVGPMPTAAAVAAAAATAKIQAMESVQASVVPLPPPVLLPIASIPPPPPAVEIPPPGLLTAITLCEPVLSSSTKAVLPPPIILTTVPPITTVPIPPPTLIEPPIPRSKKSSLDDLEDEDIPLAPSNDEDLDEDIAIKGGSARQAMMRRLMRNKQRTEPRVMVLRNMVGAEEVDEELEPEITEECSKYGLVKRVVIYQERQDEKEDADVEVKIFVEFSENEEMLGAIKVLNGRYFGGRQVVAQMYDMILYETNDLSG